MNFKITLSLLLSAAAFFISIYLLFTRQAPEKESAENKKTQEEKYLAPEAEEFEIAHFMTRIQVFHNKLYFAGKNKNTALANFYLNELEEEMGAIAEAGVFDVDVNISDNIKIYGLRLVDNMRKNLANNFDSFEQDFEQLTLSCNSCHTVTKHEYVKIILPESPIFTNQEYK